MRIFLNTIFLIYISLTPFEVQAQLNQYKPAELEGVHLEEHLGDTIPLDVRFATSEGDSVTIAELMEDGKPVLLNPLYYECPMLCGIVLEGVYKVVDELVWTPGVEYTIISFSIDPKEDHHVAAEYKEQFLSDLNRPEASEGWHFLTGSEESIQKITNAVGFGYQYHEMTGEYLHPASIMFLSPEGTITRYLYGIEFSEFDLRNALYESADGKIGTVADKVILYCFSYDASTQSYVPVAINIMKLGGLATVIILGIFLGLFWIKERRTPQSQTFEFQE